MLISGKAFVVTGAGSGMGRPPGACGPHPCYHDRGSTHESATGLDPWPRRGVRGFVRSGCAQDRHVIVRPPHDLQAHGHSR